MSLLLQNIVKTTCRQLKNVYVVVFLNGFLLASAFYFYMEDTYENQLFHAMASYIKGRISIQPYSEENILRESLQLTHCLGHNRSIIFENKEIHASNAYLINPITYDLMTANNACASYSFILSRLLSELSISNRIGQMRVDGVYGGHIMVEAKTSNGWVALDGLYNLCFKKANGGLASFADIQQSWDKYCKQVPADYDKRYSYDGVRYTNWDKIPVLMPLLKRIFYLIIGKEQTELFCLRTLLLRKFHLLFEITIVLYLLQMLVLIYRYIRKSRPSRTNLSVLFQQAQNNAHEISIERIQPESSSVN